MSLPCCSYVTVVVCHASLNKMSTPTKQIMLQFVNGLRCRSDDARLKTASDLYCFATNDLMELPSSEITSFQDDLIQHIFEMISSPEMNDKKGGILCIGEVVFKINQP